MPIKKTNLQKELLRSQKPKKRNRFYFKKGLVKTLSVSLFFAIFIPTSIHYLRIILNKNPISIYSDDWHIFFDPLSDISGEEKTRIEKLFESYVLNNINLDLNKLSHNILKDSEYSKLHLFRFHPTKIFISLNKHKSVFQIKVDTIRLVSTDGIVYGLGTGSGLPLLSGDFFPKDHVFTYSNSNEITVSQVQRARLLEAVELINEARHENIIFKEVWFKKYRGYFASLNGTGTVISFGRRPFRGKIKKLRKILYKLSTRGQKASHIELDFEDKAFIKEYKL